MAKRLSATCPWCAKENFLSTQVSVEDGVKVTDVEQTPRDGDFGFCIECSGLYVFDSEYVGWTRKPNDAEQETMDKSPTVKAVFQADRDVREMKGEG